jgi:RNA polymerase sigma factor (sigma-70 family)
LTDTESDMFACLFHQHRRAVLGYALRRVNVEAAQDVMAETFLIAWRRRLEMPAATLPWLLGVARNLTHQHYRNDLQQHALSEELSRLRAFTSSGDGDPAGPVVERVAVLQALAKLSERDREVLILTGWDRLSNKDAAAVLQCSAATFAVALHRARARLARALHDQDTTTVHPTASVTGRRPTSAPSKGDEQR